MKKRYIKPQIVFESFELSSNIAAGCSLLSSPSAAYVCPVTDPELGFTIFASNSVCDFIPPGDHDQICYDVPLASTNVFES